MQNINPLNLLDDETETDETELDKTANLELLDIEMQDQEQMENQGYLFAMRERNVDRYFE